VRFGWIDHLFLSIACLAVIAFFLFNGGGDEVEYRKG